MLSHATGEVATHEQARAFERLLPKHAHGPACCIHCGFQVWTRSDPLFCPTPFRTAGLRAGDALPAQAARPAGPLTQAAAPMRWLWHTLLTLSRVSHQASLKSRHAKLSSLAGFRFQDHSFLSSGAQAFLSSPCCSIVLCLGCAPSPVHLAPRAPQNRCPKPAHSVPLETSFTVLSAPAMAAPPRA